MNIGQFVAAEIIIILVISSVEKLILGLETFYDLLTSLEKLGQVVDKELEEQDGEISFAATDPLLVELENVSFSFPEGNKKIIDDVSLKITPNCKILINGKSGSGKTTLLRIISGILEPNSGGVYVNDKSLYGINLNHYRSHLGQSLPEESPFEGTILNNITFGDTTVSQERINWALKNVGLTEFVKEQPRGLQTMLYPEGQQLPYTVAKKIVMARSIVRKPKLLILKDPLDHFEKEESTRLMNFLGDPSNGWALLVVSENRRWNDYCTRVITMEKGRLIDEKVI
jgi:ABC-type bacteriocin/lantibiotic exporter with double-glycine peptidase domain